MINVLCIIEQANFLVIQPEQILCRFAIRLTLFFWMLLNKYLQLRMLVLHIGNIDVQCESWFNKIKLSLMQCWTNHQLMLSLNEII